MSMKRPSLYAAGWFLTVVVAIAVGAVTVMALTSSMTERGPIGEAVLLAPVNSGDEQSPTASTPGTEGTPGTPGASLSIDDDETNGTAGGIDLGDSQIARPSTDPEIPSSTPSTSAPTPAKPAPSDLAASEAVGFHDDDDVKNQIKANAGQALKTKVFSGKWGSFEVGCRGIAATAIAVRPAAGWRELSRETGPDDDVEAVLASATQEVEISVFCNRSLPTLDEVEFDDLDTDD